jgi:hypothetical protein
MVVGVGEGVVAIALGEGLGTELGDGGETVVSGDGEMSWAEGEGRVADWFSLEGEKRATAPVASAINPAIPSRRGKRERSLGVLLTGGFVSTGTGGCSTGGGGGGATLGV